MDISRDNIREIISSKVVVLEQRLIKKIDIGRDDLTNEEITEKILSTLIDEKTLDNFILMVESFEIFKDYDEATFESRVCLVMKFKHESLPNYAKLKLLDDGGTIVKLKLSNTTTNLKDDEVFYETVFGWGVFVSINTLVVTNPPTFNPYLGMKIQSMTKEEFGEGAF